MASLTMADLKVLLDKFKLALSGADSLLDVSQIVDLCHDWHYEGTAYLLFNHAQTGLGAPRCLPRMSRFAAPLQYLPIISS